jgi:protein-S-isoprenylcysteine O-methyltransferase Ste14
MLRNLISFLLPFCVLILIPYWIEGEIIIKFSTTFFIGCLVIYGGLYIMIHTISLFIRIGKGTLAPWSPTKKLVTSGMYGYVRNPMILGVLVVLIGESVLLCSLKILLWAVIFFVINNIYFLIYEEPDLERRFGDEYRDYKKNVGRWIPKLKPFKPDLE